MYRPPITLAVTLLPLVKTRFSAYLGAAVVIQGLVARAQCVEAQVQGRTDPFIVERPQFAPAVGRVWLRGDTAFFFEWRSQDSSAWVFDRLRRSFDRISHAALPFETSAPYDISDQTLYGERYTLEDSLVLATADVPGIPRSNVLRWGGRTIALRGPRVAAERRWRLAHGLSAKPRRPSQEDEGPSSPRIVVSDWGPIQVTTVARDSQATWVGLRNDRDLFGEFALGGLLRVDRRTRAVSVVTDSLLLHTSVVALLPWRGQYVALLNPGDWADSSTLAFFDPRSRHARRIGLPRDIAPYDVTISGDTAWIAAGKDIAVLDLTSGRVERRGFRLAVHGDTITYDLADRTRQPPLQFAAAVALSRELGVPDIGALIRAATRAVTVDAFQVYDAEARFPETIDRDTSAAADGAMLANASGLVLGGLESPVLRPFLYEAMRVARTRQSDYIANLFVEAHDTAAIAALHAALDRMDSRDSLSTYPFDGAEAGPVAAALALLGDSTGVRWARTALGLAAPADVRRELENHKRSPALENTALDVAGRLRDSVVQEYLIRRLRDSSADWVAARLFDYGTSRAWRGVLENLSTNAGFFALYLVFDRVARDSTGKADDPVVRDGTRERARQVFESGQSPLMQSAGVALARYGNADDLPSIIGAIARDSTAYEAAILTLVRITGDGVDAMPSGAGTLVNRTAAARWWRDWYDAHRTTFRAATRREGELAWIRMHSKLHR